MIKSSMAEGSRSTSLTPVLPVEVVAVAEATVAVVLAAEAATVEAVEATAVEVDILEVAVMAEARAREAMEEAISSPLMVVPAVDMAVAPNLAAMVPEEVKVAMVEDMPVDLMLPRVAKVTRNLVMEEAPMAGAAKDTDWFSVRPSRRGF
jgi:hypothetical protein